ncbi:isochorismatase family protein [Paenibacillus bovis]|uniref:isochorismatase n=1 Tax=Paenibacillus bovis TaxID=1616788 RepID=A0A172ZLG2_9BACL|nr:isochorismatase family protein [Paenibacillus bovis]ANF98087.1 Isochorismatase [Paenibacillus bovis]
MALPKIESYPMPGEAEFPVNKVNWTADPQRAVLLIHDMQNYFVNAFAARDQSPISELLEHTRQLRDYCHEQSIPVVYSAQPGGQTPEQRGLQLDFWGNGIDGGPDQKRIVPELEPDEQDILMTKWRYSAFQKTDLAEMMSRQGRDQLMICGIYAHIGCLMTSCEAFMQDIQAFLIGDAVADFSQQKHRMALEYAAERCAVTITTDCLLKQLGATEAVDGVRVGMQTESAQPLTEVTHSGDNTMGTDYSAPSSGASEAAAVSEQPEYTVQLNRIRTQVAAMLGEQPEHITDTDDLVQQWGLDSIRIMTLSEQWRREGSEVSFMELAEQPVLSVWARLLYSRSEQVLPNGDYL